MCAFFSVHVRQPFLFSTLRSFSASKSLPCKFSTSKEKKTETSATEGTQDQETVVIASISLLSRVLKVEVSISDKG